MNQTQLHKDNLAYLLSKQKDYPYLCWIKMNLGDFDTRGCEVSLDLASGNIAQGLRAYLYKSETLRNTAYHDCKDQGYEVGMMWPDLVEPAPTVKVDYMQAVYDIIGRRPTG